MSKFFPLYQEQVLRKVYSVALELGLLRRGMPPMTPFTSSRKIAEKLAFHHVFAPFTVQNLTLRISHANQRSQNYATCPKLAHFPQTDPPY